MKRQLTVVLFVIAFFGWNQSVRAGEITGTVTYEGEAPKLKPLKMDADPICVGKHTEDVMPQSIVLSERNTLGNIFVYVKSGLPKTNFPVPTEPVVINQQGCMYTPHVIGVMAGQPVKILNPDGTLHNVHALSKAKANPEFNLAMPKFRTEITTVFKEPEFMFPIKCDVHPWMGAWVTVMAHPYFAVTGVDGKFTIPKLPPGTYEVEAWHEKLGTQSASITITGDEKQEANFKFSRPAEK